MKVFLERKLSKTDRVLAESELKRNGAILSARKEQHREMGELDLPQGKGVLADEHG